jgi:hypothetical protein
LAVKARRRPVAIHETARWTTTKIAAIRDLLDRTAETIRQRVLLGLTPEPAPVETVVIGLVGSHSTGQMQGSFATPPYAMALALSTFAVSGSRSVIALIVRDPTVPSLSASARRTSANVTMPAIRPWSITTSEPMSCCAITLTADSTAASGVVV